MNDVVVNKTESIQRCVRRAREEYAATDDFAGDYTRQDAAILNVTRACEQAIDLANHVIRAETFDHLVGAGILDAQLGAKLKKMVGFRHAAVHEYQDLDFQVVAAVIRRGLDDLLAFTDRIFQWDRG